MISYDQKTFEQVYKSNYRQMYRFAYSILEDAEDARDTVSQVFAQLWHSQPPLTSAIVTSYLMAAVRNHSLNTLRTRRQNATMVQELQTQQMEHEQTERNEFMEELAAAIETGLTPQARRVLDLHYDQEMTYAETAHALGISPSAVNKHITHSLYKLRTILKSKPLKNKKSRT